MCKANNTRYIWRTLIVCFFFARDADDVYIQEPKYCGINIGVETKIRAKSTQSRGFKAVVEFDGIIK